MELTLRQLRRLIREAIGDRGWPGDKAHLICYVLAQNGAPMARPDVMRKVEEIEGKNPANFQSNTNNSYWSPAEMTVGDWVPDPARPGDQWARIMVNKRKVPNTSAGHAARFSVMRRGLVQVAGKKGNKLLYSLTPEGQRFADETAAWLKENPDAVGNIAPDSTWDKWERDREKRPPPGEPTHGFQDI